MEYRVQARNTAVDSENRIHRDDTASSTGSEVVWCPASTCTPT